MNWKRIEIDIGQDFPYQLDSSDECYYARERMIGGIYSDSEANQLIFNLQKPISKRNTPEWYYKDKAISKFAFELNEFLPQDNDFSIMAVPSHRSINDPDYDPRLQDVLKQVKTFRRGLTIERPIEVNNTIPSAHSNGLRRAEKLCQFYKWVGLNAHKSCIFVVDDVVTSGGHFKACKRMILENYPGIEVIGLFWAKNISRDRQG